MANATGAVLTFVTGNHAAVLRESNLVAAAGHHERDLLQHRPRRLLALLDPALMILQFLVVLLLRPTVLRLGCGFAVLAGEPTTAFWIGGILTETPQIFVCPRLPHLFLRDGLGPLHL